MKKFKQMRAQGSKPYRVKRYATNLRGGPFSSAIVWLDDPGTTAWFKVNGEYGRYVQGKWIPR